MDTENTFPVQTASHTWEYHFSATPQPPSCYPSSCPCSSSLWSVISFVCMIGILSAVGRFAHWLILVCACSHYFICMSDGDKHTALLPFLEYLWLVQMYMYNHICSYLLALLQNLSYLMHARMWLVCFQKSNNESIYDLRCIASWVNNLINLPKYNAHYNFGQMSLFDALIVSCSKEPAWRELSQSTKHSRVDVIDGIDIKTWLHIVLADCMETRLSALLE